MKRAGFGKNSRAEARQAQKTIKHPKKPEKARKTQNTGFFGRFGKIKKNLAKFLKNLLVFKRKRSIMRDNKATTEAGSLTAEKRKQL